MFFKISSLEAGLEAKTTECLALREELSKANSIKIQFDKKILQLQTKLSKLQNDLYSEQQMNKLVLKDKELLSKQKDELEKLRIKVYIL